MTTMYVRATLSFALALSAIVVGCGSGNGSSNDDVPTTSTIDARGELMTPATDIPGFLGSDLVDAGSDSSPVDSDLVAQAETVLPADVDDPEDLVAPSDVDNPPDSCDCGTWECGTTPGGCQCGSCPSDFGCTDDGKCVGYYDCQLDEDCPSDFYCTWNYEGEVDPQSGFPMWSNLCFPEHEGGSGLGEPCGNGLAQCKHKDLCVDGYCSGLCLGDGDCGGNQLCTVFEYSVDLDDDGYGDQALPLQSCQAFPGSQQKCYANASCPAGEKCLLTELPNLVDNPDMPGKKMLHPDGPYEGVGFCATTPSGAVETGESCFYGDECQGGFSLGAYPDYDEAGFCTELCEKSSDCPDLLSGGTTFKGLCSAGLFGWGGDFNVPEFNIYLGLCYFTPASLADCSANYGCPATEACLPRLVTYGPQYSPSLEHLCTSTENWGEPQPSKLLGEECDPNAEDSEGYAMNECLSGLCWLGPDGWMGYCTAPCNPQSDSCSSGGPDMKCLPTTPYPRKGAYAANAATYHLCQRDIECTPCSHQGYCPGERVCVNLGQDDSYLADYRCVDSCSSNADCASSGATTCTLGYDNFGKGAKGCFAMQGPVPANHCN